MIEILAPVEQVFNGFSSPFNFNAFNMKMRNQICNKSISVEIVMEILNMHSTKFCTACARARVLCISNLVFEHFVLENILSLRKYSYILSKRITEDLIWCGGQVFSWKMSAIRIIDDKCKHSARHSVEMRSAQHNYSSEIFE